MGDIQTQLPVALVSSGGTNTVAITAGASPALWVHSDGTGTIVSNAGSGTFTVSVSNTPTVVANAGSGTFTTSGTVTGTVTVSVSNTPTVVANAGSGSFTVNIAGGSNTVVANAGSGTFTVSSSANTATITTGSIVASTTSITATTTGYTMALVTVHGTYAGVTFGFNLSDDAGATYYPVEAVRSDFAFVGTSVTPGSNASAAYWVQLGGANKIQVLASAWVSGSATIGITPINDPTSPVVYVANSITTTPTGTQTVAFSTGTGTVVLSGNTNTVVGAGTFTTSLTGTGTVVANAGSGTFTVTGSVTAVAGSGTFTVSVSNTATVVANAGSGTFTAVLSGNTNTVVANAGSGTFTVTGTVASTPGEDTTGLVQFYTDSASIAAAGTATVTYTAGGTTAFYLKTVQAASSGGPCKVQVCVGSRRLSLQRRSTQQHCLRYRFSSRNHTRCQQEYYCCLS